MLSELTLQGLLHQSKLSSTYLATHKTTKQKYAVKVLADEIPTQKQIKKYIKEHTVAKMFEDHEGVVKSFGVEDYGYKTAIILEFFGESLAEFMKKNTLSLSAIIQISIQLAETLKILHEREVIHGRLHPLHILVQRPNNDDKDVKVKLTDLGYCTEMNKACALPINTSTFENSLLYMSPEQTGRMNRSIDTRTDLYSLGCIMYEMLSGSPPFVSEQPLELVHSHIAKKPTPLSKIKINFPTTLSNIVQKLLAKTTAKRYQTAQALKLDLQACMTQLEQTKSIHDFEIGKHDVWSILQVSAKLYGREHEVKQLLTSCEMIFTGAIRRKMVLVSGYSGVGKTVLINEIHKPLTRDRGYFIFGKVDQYQKNMPYSALTQAFQQLMKLLLAEGEEKLQYWKNRILSAIGSIGQVIIDVLPEVELIIGPQPSVPILPAAENENRFKQAVYNFLDAIASRDHPLVLFLDDIQWADLSTFKLLEELMVKSNISYFLLLGAYRDNEVNSVHPLISTIQQVEQQQPVEHIRLQPLDLSHINQLIADTVHLSLAETKDLSQLVHSKTEGNPFFVVQLLYALANEKLLRFCYQQSRWVWNIQQIYRHPVTENVLNVLLRKIYMLPAETQQALSLAAIIGSKFNVALLSMVFDKSTQETTTAIWSAVKCGLILQEDHESGDLFFMHDKVQQTCYELNTQQSRSETRLKIGRIMLKQYVGSKLEENIFEVLVHFTKASHLLINELEQKQIAELCLRAGRKAKLCSAFHSCAEYATFGISLLSNDCWHTDYSLMFELHKLLCEGEYLRGNFSQAEQLYDDVAAKCKQTEEKIAIYSIQATQYEAQLKYFDALSVTFQSLKHLGIDIPMDPKKVREMIPLELLKVSSHLNGRKVKTFLNSPEMKCSKQNLAMNLLVNLWTPLYCYGDQFLLALVSFITVNFTLENGISSVSPLAFIIYSFISAHFTKDYREAFEFGELGIALLEKYPKSEIKYRCFFSFYIGVHNWIAPLDVSIERVEQAFHIALEHGDTNYASYIANQIFTLRLFSGQELNQVYDSYQKYIDFLKKTNGFAYRFGWCVALSLPWLLGKDVQQEEQQVVQEIDKYNELVNKGTYYYGKMIRSYWARDESTWLQNADVSLEVSSLCFTANFHLVEGELFAALVYLASFNSLPENKKDNYMSKVDKIIENFSKWAVDNPRTFHHKHMLLLGEKARVQGESSDVVVEYLENAISSAMEAKFTQFAALGNELLGRYWLSKKRVKYAAPHLQGAYYLYDRYGAVSKLKQLASEFPEHIQNIKAGTTKIPSASLGSPSDLDVQSVLKASEAMFSELNLDQFLKYIMGVILENSSSHKATFIKVEPNQELLVVASSNIAPEQQKIQSEVMAVTLAQCADTVPKSIIRYVARLKEIVIIDDCSEKQSKFLTDSYFNENGKVKSLMCLPIMKHHEFKGILYLESTTMKYAYSKERARVLGLLGVQIALNLENEKFLTLLESEKRYKALATELEGNKKNLERFIDCLCHELRNPMNGIIGNQALLMEEVSHIRNAVHNAPENIKSIVNQRLLSCDESLDAISISSSHLKDILDTVLTVSMLENKSVKLQYIPFDLKDVLSQVIKMFKLKLKEKRLELISNMPENTPMLIGDPYRLKEIFINLISNAIKFTQDGTIELTCIEKSRTDILVSYEFDVKDTGIGMTAEEQAKLFKPFSQANSTTGITYGGYGLGLMICKDLLGLMGGDINVSSAKQKGTCFTFHVPFELCKQQIEKVTTLPDIVETPKSTPPSPSKTSTLEPSSLSSSPIITPKSPVKLPHCTILVVEDNLINMKILVNILKSAGVTTLTAMNGLEACSIYYENNAIDLIFMDIQMPVLNGTEATARIREYERTNNIEGTAIIGVSANARKEHKSSALAVGFNDYITKPFNREDIYRAVTTFVKKATSP